MTRKKLEQRTTRRLDTSNFILPVTFALGSLDLEIVNYHFGGACLICPEGRVEEIHALYGSKDIKLDFYVGTTKEVSNIPSQIVWEDLRKTRSFGVRFTEITKIRELVGRSKRLSVNSNFPLSLETTDPFDPIRIIFFTIHNYSKTGLGVSTSLSNKHLISGIKMPSSTIRIPTGDQCKVDLQIKHATGVGKRLHLGLEITKPNDDFAQLIKKYFTLFDASSEDISSFLNETSLRGLGIKNSIRFEAVKDKESYQKVLKLRYIAYAGKDKVATDQTWESMGEGINSEGEIIAAYSGGKLLSTVELRFNNFRSKHLFDPIYFKNIAEEKTFEANKLAIHPEVQGSDAVMGIFQRIHAIALLRGNLDVIVMSTDELAKVYFRMGFQAISGATIKHPTVKGLCLHLLHLAAENYLQSGSFVNPEYWDKIYREMTEYLTRKNSNPKLALGEVV